MIAEFWNLLAVWSAFDTWIVVTGALAAMACSLPGVFLVLRRQSMMGDALSHTSLLGIVLAHLLSSWLHDAGYLSTATYEATRYTFMFGGALLIGVLSSLLTEGIQKLGGVEASAALGVVFTTMFAAALLLVRLFADQAHIDTDHVLFGNVELTPLYTIAGTSIPQAAAVNAIVLFINFGFLLVFYKELKISTFDPALATSLGFNSQALHYALMAVTAATLVAAFESVGSILVIAMLIVPAATAGLLTDRLSSLILVAVLVACLSAVLGHALAMTLPVMIFGRLGFAEVLDASTSGMMAAACGLSFAAAMIFGPKRGALSRLWRHSQLRLKIAREDVLGYLYRVEEGPEHEPMMIGTPSALGTLSGIRNRLAVFWLKKHSLIGIDTGGGYRLTLAGQEAARQLVRAHRLWESYMAKHFELPGDHLHETAARVEHYIDPDIQERLSAELDTPELDPHGRQIPFHEEGEQQ